MRVAVGGGHVKGKCAQGNRPVLLWCKATQHALAAVDDEVLDAARRHSANEAFEVLVSIELVGA